jgi:hypothetical protein
MKNIVRRELISAQRELIRPEYYAEAMPAGMGNPGLAQEYWPGE